MYKVYYIYNDVNDKIYVGMTKKTLRARLNGHRSKLNQPEKEMTPFQREMKLLGKDNFHIKMIAETKDKREALKLERYYIEKFKTIENGYNTFRGGEGLQSLSDDYADEMIEIFHKTKSIRETAKRLGKAEGTISRQLTYLGVDKGKYSRVSESEQEEIKKYYKKCPNVSKTAKYFNRDMETIKKTLNENTQLHKKYSHNRKLVIFEIDKEFDSIKECCEFLFEIGLASSVNNCKPKVNNCLNGYKKTYLGFHYVDKE